MKLLTCNTAYCGQLPSGDAIGKFLMRECVCVCCVSVSFLLPRVSGDSPTEEKRRCTDEVGVNSGAIGANPPRFDSDISETSSKLLRDNVYSVLVWITLLLLNRGKFAPDSRRC